MDVIYEYRNVIAIVASVFIIAAVVIFPGILIHNTVTTPAALTGWTTYDYDALKGTRKPLSDMPGAYDTPMSSLSVATANFGGIFTEDNGAALRPMYIGTVSTEAARLQVYGGARAIIFDIWPDPKDLITPVVCAMVDTTAWTAQKTFGFSRGIGKYSNWQLLTRNTVPANQMVQAALQAAFDQTNPQVLDPFFIILRLHGAMTPKYLDTLGSQLKTALSGNAMGPEYANTNTTLTDALSANAKTFATGKAFVIVSPDIQMDQAFASLPGVTNYAQFAAAYAKTQMAHVTNVLEQAPQQFFLPAANVSASMDATKNVYVTQPSIGYTNNYNDDGTNGYGTNYKARLDSGFQFVGVNMFSSKDTDNALTSFFQPSVFGSHSFYVRPT